MSGVRGSGRTYRIMEQMLDTVVQSWTYPIYKNIFFVSPTNIMSKHNLKEFVNKQLGKSAGWKVSIHRMHILFDNNVTIRFWTEKEPVTEESIWHTEKWRGLKDILIFEDHTLYEHPWFNSHRDRVAELSEYERKTLLLGEWKPFDNALFDREKLDKLVDKNKKDTRSDDDKMVEAIIDSQFDLSSTSNEGTKERVAEYIAMMEKKRFIPTLLDGEFMDE